MVTKEKIVKGYINLVLQNKSTKITVKDICSDVGISRKTFYNYFSYSDEILEYIFIDKIEKTVTECLKYKLSTDEFLLNIYNSYKNDKDFFTVAIKESRQNALFDIIVERMSAVFYKLFSDIIKDKIRLDYLSYKFAVEQTMLIKKWLLDGMQQSPEFLLKISLTNLNDFEIYHKLITQKKHF